MPSLSSSRRCWASIFSDMPLKRRRNSPKRLAPASSSRKIKSFHLPPITPRVVSAGQLVSFLPRAILTLRLDHYFKVCTLQVQGRGYTVSNVERKRIRGTEYWSVEKETIVKSLPRRIEKIIEPQAVVEGAGVRLKRSIGTQTLDYLDPFLLLDHFASTDRHDYEA